MAAVSDESCYMYRVFGVRLIDRLFRREGDPAYGYGRIYRLFVRPMYGVGEDTYLNYRKYPDEALAAYRPPAHVELSIWMSVTLVKAMPPAEIERFAALFRRRFTRAVERARRDGAVSGERLLHYLAEAFEEAYVR